MEAGRRLIHKKRMSKAGKKKKNGSSKLDNRKLTPRSQRYMDWSRNFYLTLPYPIMNIPKNLSQKSNRKGFSSCVKDLCRTDLHKIKKPVSLSSLNISKLLTKPG